MTAARPHASAVAAAPGLAPPTSNAVLDDIGRDGVALGGRSVLLAAAGACAAWWVTDVAAAVPISLVGVIGLAAAVSDARTSRIPNSLVAAALVVLACSWAFVAVLDGRPMLPLLADLAAGLVLSGAPALFVVWLVAPRVLGGGDWKLLSVLGMAMGYVAPLGATVIVMGAFIGGVGVAVTVRRRNIILGPPLALGYAAAVVAVAVWPELFGNWYR